VRAELAPSPVLELSRAVAAAMADRPAAGLELAADLEAPGALRGDHPLPSTQGGLLRRLRRLSRTAQAAGSYRALELAAIDAERRYLAGADASQARPPPDPGTATPSPKINVAQMLTPFTWHRILM
jgi:predicted RNA polymerase sigma factor